MKFSTRSTYGLKAMLYLADHYGESAVSVATIAAEEGISAPYLEQILHQLKKKNWVKSVRGPRGGYVLTTKPSTISIGDILSTLGEGLRVSTSTEKPRLSRKRPLAHLASELFWKELSDSFSATLNDITLQQLILNAKESGKKLSASSGISFSI